MVIGLYNHVKVNFYLKCYDNVNSIHFQLVENSNTYKARTESSRPIYNHRQLLIFRKECMFTITLVNPVVYRSSICITCTSKQTEIVNIVSFILFIFILPTLYTHCVIPCNIYFLFTKMHCVTFVHPDFIYMYGDFPILSSRSRPI